MANYQLLKADIDAKVYQNGAQEITGANLNAVLNAMVTTLGAEYQFAGVATKDTNPETTDAKVFYIANGKGIYTNFGGLEVTEDEVVVLYWDTEWHKVATGIASQAKLTELETKNSQLGQQVIYDVTKNNPTAGSNNDGKFESLSALLLDDNLSTLIPVAVRCGGMSIRFVQTSDNKYIQARCMAQNFTTDVTQWQGVDSEPVTGSRNLVESGGVAEKLVPLQYETNGIADLLYNTDSNNGSGLITLKNTPQSFVTVTLSGNIGKTNVISCNDNLANKDKIVYGKNWTGRDNANRAFLKVKVKPNSKFSIIYSGIDSGISVAAFETDSYNASTSRTSHTLTSGEKSTFVTYSETEWLAILFVKTSPISPSDLANLIIRCNEGESIINVDNISDTINISDNGTGIIKCFNELTYIYTENDNAQIDVNYSTKVALIPYLIVCGYDATEPVKSVAKKAMENGYGYICGESEYDDGLNSFIDSFIDVPIDIHFYGTIRTKFGIHKHPLHNLYGSDCTVKMGDNIGTDYVSCIFPTSGGLTFEQQQVISHHYTVIKGFTLDGNCENNKVGTNYVFDSVYGGVIMPEIYNEKVSPYSRTQSVKDLILENIKAVNTMRGIIVGTNWICRNLEIGDSVTDHALYIAGGDNAIVENVYIYGTHNRGAIAISPQSWVVSRRVRNVHLRNIKLDECQAVNGPLLDIRGHFSDWGNNKGLDNVFIDGLYIQNITTTIPARAIMVGTQSANMVGAGYMSYTMNVVMRDVFVDAKVRNSLFVINNASFVSQNMYIIFRDYNPERPLFNIQGNSNIVKSIDLSSLRLYFYMESEYETPYVLFGIDNSDSNYRLVDGFNIDNACLYGIRNFYLFGRAGEDKNVVSVTDVSAEKLCIYPLATIKPGDENYISISPKQYYSL